MLNAFRLLRVRGDIEELIITFCDGSIQTTNKFGQVKVWPINDPVIDVEASILAEIIGWGLEANKTD